MSSPAHSPIFKFSSKLSFGSVAEVKGGICCSSSVIILCLFSRLMTCQLNRGCGFIAGKKKEKKKKGYFNSLRAGEKLRTAAIIASKPNPLMRRREESQKAEVSHRMDSVKHFQFHLRRKPPVLRVGSKKPLLPCTFPLLERSRGRGSHFLKAVDTLATSSLNASQLPSIE